MLAIGDPVPPRTTPPPLDIAGETDSDGETEVVERRKGGLPKIMGLQLDLVKIEQEACVVEVSGLQV
jgi:hypothetical protein